MKILVTVVAVLVLELLGALVFRSAGMMNVAAINPPSGFEEWFFGGISDNSVESHAKDIPAIDHDDADLLKAGLAHYDEMCVDCHGAPGAEDSEIAKGLNPPAPHLWEDGQDLSDAELYWVVKNGIKMSGMPAFGPTHDDQALRGLVAFIRQLPSLEGGKYQALVKSSGLEEEGEEHEGEAHEHGGEATPAPGTP